MYDDYTRLFEEVPKRLRRLREERGLTRIEVSTAIGAHKNSLERWELGLHLPGPFMVKRLAAFYGVTLEDILGDWREEGRR